MPEAIDAHRGDETEVQHDMLRHQRTEERIRELFEIGPHAASYGKAAMQVLTLNRQRPRGHQGRILLARDIKMRREIQRFMIDESLSDTSAS